MENNRSTLNITVTWRGNKYIVEMNCGASLKNLGNQLQKLTDVKADTMRLIVPQFSNKSSKLLYPFSNEHSHLSLEEASITEGKSIRMMGVFEDEVDKVLQNAKIDLRIAGFDEEEKRMRQRMSDRPHTLLKLPEGPYIFCDFRTLELPGVELNPPASEALKRMHMLAADPGIVAIMNKHRWRVGVMTEMAPVGYVGVSPKCILGFNKNNGEEISLRLRTDDLKGFRKYESIKKTLLHELAHMVYSEHDANFYALDKQLNQEAASLDWTKSRGYTLNGARQPAHYEEDIFIADNRSLSQRLGGNGPGQLASARASSVAAAYRRLASVSTDSSRISEVNEEPDLDDSSFNMHEKSDTLDNVEKDFMDIEGPHKSHWKPDTNLDPDEHSCDQGRFEPGPDDSQGNHFQVMGILNSGIQPGKTPDELDPDELEAKKKGLGDRNVERFYHNESLPIIIIEDLPHLNKASKEPDPDESEADIVIQAEPDPDDDLLPSQVKSSVQIDEPDPDDPELRRIQDPKKKILGHGNIERPSQNDSLVTESIEDQPHPDPEEHQAIKAVEAEPDPDDTLISSGKISSMQVDEPDPDDQELQRIQDPITVVCGRLQKAIEMLRTEISPAEATATLQTLFKIIRNVLEHPGEMKFKKLRKANPIIQKNVASHQAAMEILHVVGFSEDVVYDEIGKVETYLVLKRNDLGLLWLAKSSLEACMAH